LALISKRTIAEVNSRLDAISVVGDYVRLEQKSGRWWGRCPFHGGGQEKTPSFKVDPDLKMYHCFGCNKGGSVIGFVMEMDKLSYPEAIKNLANKIGIEIIYEEGANAETESDNTFKEELYELYRRATLTFQHFLSENKEGKDALKYILDRGITKETIENFKLGFAPGDRDFLHNFLKQKGYSDSFLEKSGLFSSRYKTIPLFSGRLMFPITDRQGKIVAFGGRSLPGALQSDGKEPPKYINSPETEIYKKGQTLFAIDSAKPQMRQTKTVYIAEGYIDVMALHQCGITNAVAPLGTAFTDEQASWLRRWVDNINLIFDNDDAGQKAAYKAILTCRKNGINCSIVDMQNDENDENSDKFKDPGEILQNFGSEILKKKVKFIINDFEYLILRAKTQFAVKGDIIGAARFMFPYLDALESEVERSDYITRIADIYKIERNAVSKDFLQWKSSGFKNHEEKPAEIKQELKIHKNDDLRLLVSVALNMELFKDFRTSLEIKEIDDPAAKELFIAMEDCFKHDEDGIDSLLGRIGDDNLRKFVSDCGTSGEFKGDFRKFMEDGIKRIKIKKFEKRSSEINSQMRESERTEQNTADIDELLSEKMFIDSQIRKLKDN